MSFAQRLIGVGIFSAAFLGLGYVSWRLTPRAEATVCELSGRPIHPNMRTVAYIGNQRKVLCCPTCALSAAAQTHLPVRFEELTDYDTGRSLRPQEAFAVEGSGVVPCDRVHGATTAQMLNEDGQPVPVVFDRCSPSILAFASRDSADRFAAEYGGTVDTFLATIRKPLPVAKR